MSGNHAAPLRTCFCLCDCRAGAAKYGGRPEKIRPSNWVNLRRRSTRARDRRIRVGYCLRAKRCNGEFALSIGRMVFPIRQDPLNRRGILFCAFQRFGRRAQPDRSKVVFSAIYASCRTQHSSFLHSKLRTGPDGQIARFLRWSPSRATHYLRSPAGIADPSSVRDSRTQPRVRNIAYRSPQ